MEFTFRKRMNAVRSYIRDSRALVESFFLTKIEFSGKDEMAVKVKYMHAHFATTVARWFFLTKNPNLGKFWRVFQWKMLVYFMDAGSILRPFAKFCGHLR
jgi:hypothetical protein